jgi:hypothetical protein
MKPLTEADVLRAMREEWNARKRALSEEVDLVLNTKVDGPDKEPIITPELKVRHKKSQIRYTVVSVGPRDVILKTPEGEQFLVGADELEDQYSLD